LVPGLVITYSAPVRHSTSGLPLAKPNHLRIRRARLVAYYQFKNTAELAALTSQNEKCGGDTDLEEIVFLNLFKFKLMCWNILVSRSWTTFAAQTSGEIHACS
jgi:hypothetical protein